MIPFSKPKKDTNKMRVLSPSQRLRLAITSLWELGVSRLNSEEYYEQRIKKFEEQIAKEIADFNYNLQNLQKIS